ncbi:MAG: amidohydrolase family protein [Alphaproteobacteria bacterium]
MPLVYEVGEGRQAGPAMTIDAHVHIWAEGCGYEVWLRRKIAGIDRDFTIADLMAASSPAGISGVVLVHATEEPAETELLIELAEREPFVRAVVGWADVAAGDLGHRLDRYMRSRKFRGLRAMPAFAGDAGWLARPAVREGLAELTRRGLTLDLLATPVQLPEVLRLAHALPELKIMLNHCGRPLTATGMLEPWATALRALAWSTPVYCKLSSLAERAGMDWRVESLAPYVDVVLDAFGPERLAFGSNWPVVNIAASYGGWWQALAEMLARHPLTPEARAAIFGGTAAAFYGLDGIQPPTGEVKP